MAVSHPDPRLGRMVLLFLITDLIENRAAGGRAGQGSHKRQHPQQGARVKQVARLPAARCDRRNCSHLPAEREARNCERLRRRLSRPKLLFEASGKLEPSAILVRASYEVICKALWRPDDSSRGRMPRLCVMTCTGTKR